MDNIKDHARKLLAKGNFAFTRKSTFDRLIRSEQQFLRYQSFLSFAQGLNSEFVKSALQLLPASKGEIFQDLFAALCIGQDTPGFFVEFGATNGLNGSNTWLLEKELGWKGILAEPGRGWHASLTGNRNCTIETDCVWIHTGQELEFTQANDAGFSTISSYAGKDRHSRHRENGQTYLVKTVSLHDMLTRANAPRAIDYISIDTEGSEFDILSHFPFGVWDISVLTIEHNFREERGAMHALLTGNGFVRVLTEQSRFDDWYVAARLLPRVQAVFSNAA
ncbi:MAG: FkbM family methyltransferase [Limnohabitans sp.]